MRTNICSIYVYNIFSKISGICMYFPVTQENAATR
jgi:hypothetical protein